MKVSFQMRLADHLPSGRSQQLYDNRRSQLYRILIMRHDQVQIVSVPGGNPKLGQFPSLFFRHGVSSELVTVESSTSDSLTGSVRSLCQVSRSAGLEEVAQFAQQT